MAKAGSENFPVASRLLRAVTARACLPSTASRDSLTTWVTLPRETALHSWTGLTMRSERAFPRRGSAPGICPSGPCARELNLDMNPLSISSRPIVKIRLSAAMAPMTSCWTTAVSRQIRSGSWCLRCSVRVQPRPLRYRTPSVPPCNLLSTFKMSLRTLTRVVSTFRSRSCPVRCRGEANFQGPKGKSGIPLVDGL